MRLRRFLAALAVVSAAGIPVLAPTPAQAFSGGAGTSGDPYRIATCSDLQEIDDTTTNLSKAYLLTANIDCTGVSFTPLVNGSTYFSGVLDGAGRDLTGLSLSCSTIYCALFHSVTSGTIKNLNVVSPVVNSTSSYVGVIAGQAGSRSSVSTFEDLTITGASVSGVGLVGGIAGLCTACTAARISLGGQVTGSGNRVGGFFGMVGESQYSHTFSISDSSTSADVTGVDFVGGLIGEANRYTYTSTVGIFNSTVSSTVSVNGASEVGGVVGKTFYEGGYNFEYVASRASVTGTVYVGGLIGWSRGSRDRVYRSYTTGALLQTDNSCGSGAGGITAGNDSNGFLTIIESYSTSAITATCRFGGLVGNSGTNRCTITDSFFRGSLVRTAGSTESIVGGITGRGCTTITRSYAATTSTQAAGGGTSNDSFYRATCADVFWDKESSGRTATTCIGAAAGKTTAEMKTQSTFTNFDFSAVWSMDPSINGGYPFLTNAGGFVSLAPTVVLSAVASTSTSRNIQFRLTATSGQIDCSTVSATDGVDFDLTNIVSITIAQTSSTVCTISAVSTISADGATGTSSLAEASSFSVSYSGSANQTNISSGSPASVAVSIPSAATTTTVAPTTTTIAQATTTTNAPSSGASVTTTTVVGSPTTTVAPSNTAPTGVAGGATTTVPSRDNGADTDETVTPAASATTTTTTTVAPTTTLPSIDVPPVSAGGGALTIGGQRVEATITRENNQLIVEAGPIVARISALKREGGRAPLDADGRIRLMSGDSVEVEVTGFGPSTEVEVRLYSEPTLLGRSGVNAEGQLLASYEIPDGISDGDHTVVLAGESREAEELVFALSVAIGEPGEGAPWFTIFVLVPLGLAAIGALVIPAVLRRRRSEQPA